MRISHWRYTVPLRLRSLFRRRQVEKELDEEFHYHIEKVIQENLSKGLCPEAAREAAVRCMDGLDLRKEECRDQWHVRLIEELGQDLRYSLRLIRRNPGFTTVAVMILALGIGANAALFSILDRLFLRPPPHIRNADDVFILNLGVENARTRGGNFPSTTSYPLFANVHDALDRLAETAAFSDEEVGFGRGTTSQEINVILVAGGYFPLLGVRPYLGNLFTDRADDKRADGVVLDYFFWKRAFNADPYVVGKDCWINNHPFVVIGVAPCGFTGAFLKRVDAWLTVASAAPYVMPSSSILNRFDASWLFVLARPRTGIPAMQVQASAAAAAGGVQMIPLSVKTTPQLATSIRISLWASSLSGLILLIACANVANLLFLRGLQRRREIAVRLQLGMGRCRLIRQLLAESFVLSCLAALASLLVMNWTASMISPALLDRGFSFAELIDLRLIVFMAFVIVASTTLTGFAAAFEASRVKLEDALKSERSGITPSASKLQNALVMTQLALAGILLIGSALFVRSFWNVSNAYLGFDAQHILAIRLSGLRNAGFSGDQISTFYARMYEIAKISPDVMSTSLTTSLPPSGAMALPFKIPGKSLSGIAPLTHVVSFDYFNTMGMKIVRGRAFGKTDISHSSPVVVINQEMARQLWPGEIPLGKCMLIGMYDQCATIVGIVEDAALWLVNGAPAQAQYYVLLDQFDRYLPSKSHQTLPDMLALLIRSKQRARLSSALTRDIKDLAGTSFVSIRTADSLFDAQRRPWRIGVTMFGLLGFLALLVATAGVYGQLSFLVKSRRHEMGVRMALGASPCDVMMLVVIHSLRIVGLGTIIGLVFALALSQLVRKLLYNVAPHDPVSFVAVGVMLVGVALFAAAIPAWRAGHVDPAQTLRHD